VARLHAGVFTAVQRFRSDLGLYVHLHCLVTDGTFEEGIADVRFLPATTPTAERMEAVLAQVHKATTAEGDDQSGRPIWVSRRLAASGRRSAPSRPTTSSLNDPIPP